MAPKFLEELTQYMSQVSKADCVTLEQARQEAGVSKGTFYTYLNYLNIQRHKFPFDRKAYIHKSDLARLKEFVQGNR